MMSKDKKITTRLYSVLWKNIRREAKELRNKGMRLKLLAQLQYMTHYNRNKLFSTETQWLEIKLEIIGERSAHKELIEFEKPKTNSAKYIAKEIIRVNATEKEKEGTTTKKLKDAISITMEKRVQKKRRVMIHILKKENRSRRWNPIYIKLLSS